MRKIRERLKISDRFRKILWVLAATFVIITVTSDCANYIVTDFHNSQFYAWWGTIYPEFCFEKGEDTDESKPVKLSFWLAKALDW